MSKIIVQRDSRIFVGIRPVAGALVSLYLNGKKQGNIWESPKVIEVPTGDYSMKVSALLNGSQTSNFALGEGETKYFIVQRNTTKTLITTAFSLLFVAVVLYLRNTGQIVSGDDRLLYFLIPLFLVNVFLYRNNSFILKEITL